MPKTGTHWSKHGELKAADSILHFINSLLINKKVPELLIGEIKTSRIMRDTDNEIEKGMNLLFEISNIEMADPKYRFIDNPGFESPRVLTIGDSFYWGMFNF